MQEEKPYIMPVPKELKGKTCSPIEFDPKGYFLIKIEGKKIHYCCWSVLDPLGRSQCIVTRPGVSEMFSRDTTNLKKCFLLNLPWISRVFASVLPTFRVWTLVVGLPNP